jgi:hypothetical protein
MVLKARVILILLALLALAPAASRGAAAEAPPRAEEVVLPVKDYLALVEKAEAAEKERRLGSSREAPVAEVTSQHVRVVLGEKDLAEVTADYEVLVQGAPQGPIVLPVTGVPRSALVKSGAGALSAGTQEGEWRLIAPAAGRYAVEISGPVRMSGGGVSRLRLAPAAAPVSLTEVDLPAGLAWSAPGTVVVEDKVEGARRTVRLTSRRGQAQTFEVRRKVDGEDAEKLIVQSQVLTLVQLRPDGPRRHDVVVYEVSRGGLDSFTVDLPPGLAVETVGTDEGEVVPAIESRRLTVQRRRQLQGTGYLVLSSTPASGVELALDPVVPTGTVQARYVALSSSVAAEAKPLPAASWSRIDLDDLPPALREALGGVDLAAAWRLASPAAAASPRMAVAPLPAAAALPAVASLRETTTLITLDGTLLHRDRITLRPAAIGTALDITLAAGATLWSAQVDDLPVRPLERGGGKITVPLGFDSGKDAVVEIISVQVKAIPAGRAELALDLPRVAVPVQQHRWRLLLPDGASYRYRSGDLRPVLARRPAAVPAGQAGSPQAANQAVWSVDGVVITDTAALGSSPAYYDFDSFEEMAVSLRKGLVGGIKPLPIAIPESGKLLLLSGVLPPEKISVELEVKGKT